MSALHFLLLPFAWLYGLVLHIRHALYDHGVLRSERPAVPTIAIGNLAMGGTGKTPMLEMVLRALADTKPIGTLSRGYGRTGNGLHEVAEKDTAELSGDEPLQVKRKFPGVRVFVGADRVAAIRTMHQQIPDLKVLVLDDALQHRQLNAGMNILLTTWQRPYCNDALLPAGRLRDVRSRRKAAQIVVVTKCPALPDPAERKRWRERLGLKKDQQLFFTGIEYGGGELLVDRGSLVGGMQQEQPGSPMQPEQPTTNNHLLFTGIADPAPLVEHVRSLGGTTEHVAFPDHHTFTGADLKRLAGLFGKFAPGPKVLVTTEKDAARLSSMIAGSALEGLPVMVIGMRAVILNEPDRFAELIHRHVATHTTHR